MKKLTGALVLSFSLLLISGCRSAGETRDKEDASTPSSGSSSTQSPTINEALDAARETVNRGDAGTGSTGTGSGEGFTAEKPSAGGSTAATLSPAERQAQENCVDRWLTEKKMDRYGHPEGTMYAGGSPLFNERTGESRDRLDYVYERQPEAKKACAGANTQGTPPKTK